MKLPCIGFYILVALLVVSGCGKKSKSTGPVEPPKQVVNQIPGFAGRFQSTAVSGIKLGWRVFYSDTIWIDTLDVCPGEFPLISTSQPEFGFEITESDGLISDSVVDFTQTGITLSLDCFDENCNEYDSCTVPFSVNVSSRETGQPPRPQGFQLVTTLTSRTCEGIGYQSFTKYIFERISDPACGHGKRTSHPIRELISRRILAD